MARPSFDDADAPVLEGIARLIVWRHLRQAEAIRQAVSEVYGDNAADPYRRRAVERLRQKYRKQRADLERAESERPAAPAPYAFTLLTSPLAPHSQMTAQLDQLARKITALAERMKRAQPSTLADWNRAMMLLRAGTEAFGKNPRYSR